MIKKSIFTLALIFSATSANAAVVTILGNNNYSDNKAVSSFLGQHGHTVNFKDTSAASAADLQGSDVVIDLRTKGSDALTDFVRTGGLLITDGNFSTKAVFDNKLLNGRANGYSEEIKSKTFILTQTAIDLGMGADGVGMVFSDPSVAYYTQVFAGAGTEVLAGVLNGGTAMVGGKADKGYVLANGVNWNYGFDTNGKTAQWLLNVVNNYDNYAPGHSGGGQPDPGPGQVPEPAVPVLLGLGLAMLAFTRRKAAK